MKCAFLNFQAETNYKLLTVWFCVKMVILGYYITSDARLPHRKPSICSLFFFLFLAKALLKKLHWEKLNFLRHKIRFCFVSPSPCLSGSVSFSACLSFSVAPWTAKYMDVQRNSISGHLRPPFAKKVFSKNRSQN